jgi:hypothetical protein
VRPLLSLEAPAQALAWSPDGRHLAWSEEGLGVGVYDVQGGASRRLEAHASAVDRLALSDGAAWVAGIDDHGHLLAWTAGLAEPVVESPGERTGGLLEPLFVGADVVRFSAMGAAAPPLPDAVDAAALATAAAERTPWRACPADGALALLPDQPKARALAACLRGR